MTFVYCAGGDLHQLVNNNTLTQYGSCIVTKRMLKQFVYMYNIESLANNHGDSNSNSSLWIIMLIMQTADFVM